MIRWNLKCQMPRADTLRVSTFVMLFVVATWTSHAYAITQSKDRYEQKGKFELFSKVFIFPPRLIVGNREALGHKLNPQSPQHEEISRAIYLSSLTSFGDNGYVVAPKEDELRSFTNLSEADEIWTEVIGFTDEGMQKKRKLLPFRIHKQISKLKNITGDSSAVVFIQLFGSFEYDITISEEMAATTAANVIVNAVTIPLAGTAVISGGSAGVYGQFDYKISVFDAQTGELVWYREGVKDGTDFRSWSKLMVSLDEIYDSELPKATNPVVLSKFKAKRSQLNERT